MTQEGLRDLFNSYVSKYHVKVSQVAKDLKVSSNYLMDFLKHRNVLSPRVTGLLESYIVEKETTSLIKK